MSRDQHHIRTIEVDAKPNPLTKGMERRIPTIEEQAAELAEQVKRIRDHADEKGVTQLAIQLKANTAFYGWLGANDHPAKAHLAEIVHEPDLLTGHNLLHLRTDGKPFSEMVDDSAEGRSV